MMWSKLHTAGRFSSPYKMCLVCGFLFPNRESLIEPSRVHTKETTPAATSKNLDIQQAGMESPKEEMVQYLNLNSKSQAETTSIPMTLIPQLDPITNYQARQVPTTEQVKESSQEGSTDNHNFCSEKEELGEIWRGRNSESPGKIKTHRSSCPGFCEDEDKPRPLEGKVPSGDGDSNLPSSKKKPTRCSECSKAFRTYQQLVLHSRVHKKNRRSKAPSPIMSVDRKQPGTCFQELTTTVEESAALEGEVGPDDLHLDKNAVGGRERKPKSSKECSYCGKFFHSNSYFLIHLSTHTGEKPYICHIYDYAAAQKSSLTKHLRRHHKDPHPMDATPEVQNEGKNQEMEDALLKDSVQTRNLKRVSDAAKDVQGSPPAKQPRETPSVFQSVLSGAGLSPTQHEPQDFCENATDFSEKMRCPGPACLDILKMRPAGETQASSSAYKSEGDGSLEGGHRASTERFDYNCTPSSGCQDRPLNLPLGTLQTYPSITLKTSLIPTMTCSFCTFKTLSREVLIMHQRVHHKFTSDMQKSKSELRRQQTSSPPALLGKDMPPLACWKKLPAKAAFPTPKALPPDEVPSRAPQFPGPASSTLAPGNLKPYRPQPCPGGLRATTQQQPELLPKVSLSAAVDEVK